MKKIILIILALSLFQLSFGITAKEYNEKGLEAYKSKDYEGAIKNFYNAVAESEKNKEISNEEKAQYYSDYGLALIKGGLVEHGIFAELYSNNLTDKKSLISSNFYNISLGLERWENAEETSEFFPSDTESYSKISKDYSKYLKGQGGKPKVLNDKSVIGKLIDESIKNNGRNTIEKLELDKNFKVIQNKKRYIINNIVSNEDYFDDQISSKININFYGEAVPLIVYYPEKDKKGNFIFPKQIPENIKLDIQDGGYGDEVNLRFAYIFTKSIYIFYDVEYEHDLGSTTFFNDKSFDSLGIVQGGKVIRSWKTGKYKLLFLSSDGLELY